MALEHHTETAAYRPRLEHAMTNSQPIPYVFVPVSQGNVAIIDADMADMVLPHTWTYHLGYAMRLLKKGEEGWMSSKKRKCVYMHRLVVECVDGMETDHANRNRLDNRRQNLRCATSSENKANIVFSRPTRYGWRGCKMNTYARRDGTETVTWQAAVKKDGVMHYCGTYLTAKEAALAYDRMALQLFGQFATLNFPDGH